MVREMKEMSIFIHLCACDGFVDIVKNMMKIHLATIIERESDCNVIPSDGRISIFTYGNNASRNFWMGFEIYDSSESRLPDYTSKTIWLFLSYNQIYV